MRYDPSVHRRRSVRLPGYDYASAGAYFVTVCVQGRVPLLGEVVGEGVRLSAAGEAVLAVWGALPGRFPSVTLDAFVVMPDHVHGIVWIGAGPEGGVASPRASTRDAPTLGDIIGAFKSESTLACARGVRTSGWPPFDRRLWQRNYWERVIRSERELQIVRRYIQENPLRWHPDHHHP